MLQKSTHPAAEFTAWELQPPRGCAALARTSPAETNEGLDVKHHLRLTPFAVNRKTSILTHFSKMRCTDSAIIRCFNQQHRREVPAGVNDRLQGKATTSSFTTSRTGHVVLIDTQTIIQRHKWPVGVITSIKRSIDGQPQSVMVRRRTQELEKSVNQRIPLGNWGLPAEDLNEEGKSKSVPPQIESESTSTILPTKTPDTLLRKRGRPPGSKNKPKDSTNQVDNGQKTKTHEQPTRPKKGNKKQAEKLPAASQRQGKEDRSRPHLPRKAKICTSNNETQDTQPIGDNQSISPKVKMFGSSAPGVSRPSYGRSQP
ncbi:hypothetical protein CRE_15799 [Caenorhabditis remanei]|uniref:Uncharacterized protein n=1 Tax=Caenorhabditis remanei TaxID=31234 RepID=E3NMF9_CAERE|nr:hypothetical protein CRE_15799 [Caenorhabditis remanei]